MSDCSRRVSEGHGDLAGGGDGLPWESRQGSLEFLRWLDAYDRSRLAGRRGFRYGLLTGAALMVAAAVLHAELQSVFGVFVAGVYALAFGAAGAIAAFAYVRWLFPMSNLGVTSTGTFVTFRKRRAACVQPRFGRGRCRRSAET